MRVWDRDAASGAAVAVGVGDVLRDWRGRQRLSQEQLAHLAGVSTRHLSYVENGRSVASRRVLLRLAAALDMPLRERNVLLVAGGYAPEFRQPPSPASAETMSLLAMVMDAAGPFPVIVVDRWWDVVARNAAAGVFLDGVDPRLVAGTVNVATLLFAPGGTGDRVGDPAVLRLRMLARLEAQAQATGDERLRGMAREARAHVTTAHGEPSDLVGASPAAAGGSPPVVAEHFTIASSAGPLTFVSTIATIGAPLEVHASELAIETFYPADEATRLRLAARHRELPPGGDGAGASG